MRIALDDAIGAFTGLKWKFYEKVDRSIRLEIPRTDVERFVVEFSFTTDIDLEAAEKKLKAAGFFLQEVRYVAA